MDYLSLEIGGGIIKRRTLLAILLVFGTALVGVSAASATDPASNSSVTVDPVNNTAGQNVVLTAHVNTNDSSIVTGGHVKFTVNSVNAGNATVNNGIATLNWLIPASWNVGTYTVTANFDGTGTNYSNSTNISTLAVNPRVIKGYWMFSQDVASANAANLKSKGITDVFVLTRGVTGVYHYSELQAAINKFHPYGIDVHAWIVAFKDDDHFVNPSGYYTYTVKIYVKTTKYWGKIRTSYKVKKKVWYKSWYKYRGKWKYKWKYYWKYVIKYKYKKGWIYTPVYRYEKRIGYNLSYNNKLINEIAAITRNYNVDGIHLDYVRYSGSTPNGNAAYQQPGGTQAAVNAVTAFVQGVSKAINSTNSLNIAGKPYIQLSAALMPEGAVNDDYYAQDYGRFADYLDFLVPMTYEGNYNANNAWITQKIQYIVNQAKGKPVYAGLTTYCSDSNIAALSPSGLQADVNSAQAGGVSGFVLFRYGIGCLSVPNWT